MQRGRKKLYLSAESLSQRPNPAQALNDDVLSDWKSIVEQEPPGLKKHWMDVFDAICRAIGESLNSRSARRLNPTECIEVLEAESGKSSQNCEHTLYDGKSLLL